YGIPSFTRHKDGRPPSLAPDHLVSPRLALYAEARRRALEQMGLENKKALEGDEEAKREYYQKRRKIVRQLREENWRPPKPDGEKLDAYATGAIRAFQTAIEKGESNGLYHLGLASILEEYSDRAGDRGLDLKDLESDPGNASADEKIKKAWIESALTHYIRAFKMSRKQEADLDHKPLAGIQSLVSYNAAKGIQRLSDQYPDFKINEDLRGETEDHLNELQELPQGPVTPIIFSTHQTRGIDQLIIRDEPVPFDMTGSGRERRWTWITPEARFLVWDPRRTNTVQSGRQLFGTFTWWLLPGDGFRAMALLDDDGDGWLSGQELEGLAAWQDKNTDGIAQEGEVQPLGAIGVTALAVQATSRDDGHPVNPEGVRLENGSTGPVWDWIAEPADPADVK
ncbi:MAG: hypothetical protein KGZ25_01230, partial [Planctomycetes bacterium]|nr:hypothetical protein [Planctomycetota bacterium]